MPLSNCKTKLILDCSSNCVIIYTNINSQVFTFTITETNLYVPVVNLSAQDNFKLLPQLKNGSKRTVIWNKYLAKPELLAQNANLNHLIEPSFQGLTLLCTGGGGGMGGMRGGWRGGLNVPLLSDFFLITFFSLKLRA